MGVAPYLRAPAHSTRAQDRTEETKERSGGAAAGVERSGATGRSIVEPLVIAALALNSDDGTFWGPPPGMDHRTGDRHLLAPRPHRGPLRLVEVDLEALRDGREAHASVEGVGLHAMLAGEQLDLEATLGAGPVEDVLHQRPADTSAPGGGCDDDVLDDRPRLAPMSEVGHDEEIGRTDDFAVCDGDCEVAPGVGEDVGEDRASPSLSPAGAAVTLLPASCS